MQKSTLPVGIKTLKGWKEKGLLTFDNPIQRSGGQWSNLQKSLLIHSLLANYPIPACYFLKEKNVEGVTVYDCLDAKQRLTSIFEFIDGGYALNAATPSFRSDDGEIELGDKTFEELPKDVQNDILSARLSIFSLEECTDEEVEEIFSRLNNSTPLSTIQKCRSIMGSDMAGWAKKVCSGSFFTHSISLTLVQLRREADLEVLLQSMLLLDSRLEGYEDWKGISVAEVTKYCGFMRGGYLKPRRLMIESCANFLAQAFQSKHKFLKKSNIPMVFVLSRIAIENKITPPQFKTFIDSFSNSVCPDYEANKGSGNIKRAKTEGRLKAIAAYFAEYFKLEGIDILDAPLGYDHPLPGLEYVDIDGTDADFGFADTGSGASDDALAEGDSDDALEDVGSDEGSADSESSLVDGILEDMDSNDGALEDGDSASEDTGIFDAQPGESGDHAENSDSDSNDLSPAGEDNETADLSA